MNDPKHYFPTAKISRMKDSPSCEISELLRGHPISTYAKFSEKLKKNSRISFRFHFCSNCD